MCNTPKFLHITSKAGTKFRLIVPCGKCYDCMNKKRAEFVFRCKTEMDDTVNNGGSCFFVTLKYSDENLVYYESFNRRYGRNQELKRIASLSRETPFRYRNFILHKAHVQKFCADLQKKIKTFHPSLLFRNVVAGEYGCFSSRPHYHLLIFSPLNYTLSDFEKLFVQPFWRYGQYDIQTVNEACINYVAKHYVKDDSGSDVQRKVAPRFCYYSRFRGSIGRSLLKDERVIRNFNNKVFYDVSGKYKVPLPRFIRKRLKPNGLTDSELEELSKKSMSDFAEQYYDLHGSSVKDNKYYSEESLESVVEDNYLTQSSQEFNKIITHKKQQFAKKFLSLRRKGYFDDDNNV